MPSTQMVIDLTSDKFDCLDVYESYLSFDIPRLLPNEITIWVWGPSVLVTEAGIEQDCYAKGYVPITFREVIGFAFRTWLYYDNGDGVHDASGKKVFVGRSWGTLDRPDVMLYDFQGVSVWPHGECDIQVRSRGSVTIDLSSVEVLRNAPVTARGMPPELERLRRSGGQHISPASAPIGGVDPITEIRSSG
ncbi:MAG: hypothetical protein IPK82_44215 [Polyangiaceae bacterium]|nr:hypothetical protein [Polyangiaceae bacterium]